MLILKGENLRIFVGEIFYLLVDIDNLVIEGLIIKNNLINFCFMDG